MMTAPVYVPGRQVLCTAASFDGGYHARGWFPPEEEYTWIDGFEGELRFSVRRPAESYTFRADLYPFSVPGPQSLELFFNCFRVGYFEFTAPGTIEVEIPAELFILRTTQVTFHCRNAAVASAYGSGDDRRLGLAVGRWVLG